jgi:hypothetical protein
MFSPMGCFGVFWGVGGADVSDDCDDGDKMDWDIARPPLGWCDSLGTIARATNGREKRVVRTTPPGVPCGMGNFTQNDQ